MGFAKQTTLRRKVICKHTAKTGENDCTQEAKWTVRVPGSSILEEAESCNRHLASMCDMIAAQFEVATVLVRQHTKR